MRTLCIDEATLILNDNGFADDEWSLLKTARAVGAALQKASLALEKLECGEVESDDDWVNSDPFAGSKLQQSIVRIERQSPSQSVNDEQTLTGLLEAW